MTAHIDPAVIQPKGRCNLSVLFLADHFAYTGGISHGVTSYYLNVLPALAASGVRVTACFLREFPAGAESLREHGIEVIGLESSRWSLAVFAKVLRLLRERRFSFIHAAQIKASMLARVIGRFVDLPVVVHVHDDILPAWPLRWANSLFGRREDRCLCVSTAVSDCAERGYKFPSPQQLVLYTGVELQQIGRYRHEHTALRAELLDIHDDRPVIGVVARFFAVKGHRSFIAALPALFSMCPTARVVFVGDGPERAECEALAAALDIQANVHFLGQRGDVAQLMNCFDMLAMPSISEGLPLVAIEALAAGVPLVGFDVGGMKEVLTHGVTGFLAPAGNLSALIESLVRLGRDKNLRAKMSAAALTDAQRFSAGRHVELLGNFYRSMSSHCLRPRPRIVAQIS